MRFTSGYVHGANDERLYENPQRFTPDEDADQYDAGYAFAFVVGRGVDCQTAPWFGWLCELLACDLPE